MALQKQQNGLWKQVEETDANVVQIDACPTCNGAWFDSGELDLLAGEETHLEANLDEESRPSNRTCPRGCGPMEERDLPGKIRTPLDHCPVCHGLWLDGHERHKLAHATTTEGQQHKSQIWARRGAIWAAQLLTQLPVEVENPARGTPWIVYSLLGILAGAFTLQFLEVIDVADCMLSVRRGGGGGVCLAPVAGAIKSQFRAQGLPALWNGTSYTVLTHVFLHGNWAHLLGNLYFLYVFGDNVEHLFGRKRFATLFLAAGVVGGLLEVLLTRSTAVPIVGASGAIAGVMAAYLWCFPRNKLFQVILFVQVKLPAWVYLFVWIGFQAVMGFFTAKGGGHVAWFSHMGGFLVGIAMTPLVLRSRRREVAGKVRVPAAGMA
jgi:membrane associated rhomboid family serine protease/Zn-finger nucleic acid-binding protein